MVPGSELMQFNNPASTKMETKRSIGSYRFRRAPRDQRLLGAFQRCDQMNNSNDPAVPAPVFDSDFIQAAHLRVVQMHESAAHPVEAPTLLELEQALGEPVTKCELWTQNWRNRVYRIELASGHTALAKQVLWGTEAMVQYQYDQLGVLARLDIPGLRVPRALAFLRAKRVYVMEFARGKTIESLVWNRTARYDLLRACELAGKILAQMHVILTETIGPL